MEYLCLIGLELWGSLLPTRAWVAETGGEIPWKAAPIGRSHNLRR